MEISGYVYQTNDYSQFKKLHGNRALTDKRAKKIKGSIKKNGWIMNPIVVNEKMEVIDGQGRLQALEELGLPVFYVIAQNAGKEECLALNAYGTPWVLKDFLSAYCEDGNESYERIAELCRLYPKFTLKFIYTTAKGKIEFDTKKFKNGEISISEQNFSDAVDILDYLTPLIPSVNRIPGKREYILHAIAFAYDHKDVDREQLSEKVRNHGDVGAVADMDGALKIVEEIYNKRKRDHVYIATDYKKAMSDKYSWYLKKWGETE